MRPTPREYKEIVKEANERWIKVQTILASPVMPDEAKAAALSQLLPTFSPEESVTAQDLNTLSLCLQFLLAFQAKTLSS